MREIKFRAWHKNNKSMCENVTTDLLDRDYLEFMQYTGLKDDNNKEIYENDIIQEGDWDDLYLIVFEDCKFIAQKIGKHNGDIFTRRNKDLDGVLFPIIVGNKYVNPNLLEKS